MILGLDPAKRNLGWALLDDVTGLPIAAGTGDLDVKDGGWMQTQVSRVFDEISVRARVLRRDVVALAMEDPFAASMSNAKAYGAVMALCQAEFHGRFGDMPFRVYLPKVWRVAAGLPGNASKLAVMDAAYNLAADPWSVERLVALLDDQDAADALMIARAYWLETNGEATWEPFPEL